MTAMVFGAPGRLRAWLPVLLRCRRRRGRPWVSG